MNFAEKGVGVGLGSYADWLGIDRGYVLDFSKKDDGKIYANTYDYVVFKPPKVLSWGDIRENNEVLYYDNSTHEFICKVPGYTMKIVSEWFLHETEKKSEERKQEANKGRVPENGTE